MPEDTPTVQPEDTQAPQPEEVPAQTEEATQPAPQPVAVKPPEVTLNVDPATAMNVTVQEFEKKIAESEANTAELKKQKAAYIYDTNVQLLIAQANQNKQQPVPEGTEGS